MLGPTAHTDTFTRDNLPPERLWPDFLLDGFGYPDHLNVGVELTDRLVAKGFGDNVALIGNGRYFAERMVCIPSGQWLSEADLAFITQTIRSGW